MEEEGKGQGKGRKDEVEGREREGPRATVEPGPLRALLRHCDHIFRKFHHRRIPGGEVIVKFWW